MNAFVTIAQFFQACDSRVMKDLSGDKNSPDGEAANSQALLDMAAATAESYLANRVSLAAAAGSLIVRLVIIRLCEAMHYARRSDKPKGVAANEKWAMDWLQMFADGKVSLPNVAPLNFPVVADSDSLEGKSEWDFIFGRFPSETGPSRGE